MEVALSKISAVMLSDTVTRNLGLFLEKELSKGDHITKLSHVCFFHLRRVRVVRHSLTRNALLTLVHAFVCSKLDVCNSVMFGVHSYLVVVKICARLPEVPLWYQGSGQNDTVGGVSPFWALTYGTHCRQEFALISKSQISSRENLKNSAATIIALLRSFSLGALYKYSLLLLLLIDIEYRTNIIHRLDDFIQCNNRRRISDEHITSALRFSPE